MAYPQLENGYTKIANELLEQFAKTNLSGYEWQVLFVIIRKTYGYNKKQDSIALSQISLLTGIKNGHVPAVLKKLANKNIIFIDKKYYINRYSLNKEYKIKIMEKYEGEIIIEAENENDALEIAKAEYENGEYSLELDLVDSDVELFI